MTLLESSHSALSVHADDVMLHACYGMVSLGGNYFTSVQCYTLSFATVPTGLSLQAPRLQYSLRIVV